MNVKEQFKQIISSNISNVDRCSTLSALLYINKCNNFLSDFETRYFLETFSAVKTIDESLLSIINEFKEKLNNNIEQLIKANKNIKIRTEDELRDYTKIIRKGNTVSRVLMTDEEIADYKEFYNIK